MSEVSPMITQQDVENRRAGFQVSYARNELDERDRKASHQWNEGGGGTGWRVMRIPSPYDLTGITSVSTTVLPGALLSPEDGGTASATGDKRVMVVQDTETTPGTLRTFLMFSEDDTATTQWSVYEWQGPSSLMTLVGTGGAVGNSVPSGSFSGGGRFYTPGQLGVRITSVSPAVGGQTITFVASGGGTRTVRFRYGADQQGATSIATLTGAATGGGTRSGNEVINVTADGATVNTVIWDFSTDGFAVSDSNANLTPEIDT